jgi:hypothetical protein
MKSRAYTERMAHKGKAALGAMSDALETACGWAFCAVALYSLLFLNLTGNGTLWDALRGVMGDALPAEMPMNAAVQTRVVPMRPPGADDKAVKSQDRMLLIPSEPEHEFAVPVVVQQQPGRGADQFTDAPADASAGTDWRKHLNGSLRTFTVYGNGDQQSVAPASAGSAKNSSGSAPARAAAPAPTPATAVSAYHAGIAAAARPGVTDHVSQVDAGTADGVQNFR